MKGGIAAFIVASIHFLEAHKEKLLRQNQGILLGFTVDEEDGCQGVAHLYNAPKIVELFQRVSYCILAEPTSMELHIGHKGINRYEVVFHGKAAHSSVPEQGVNAIYLAAKYIQKLQDVFHELQMIESPIGHPKLSVGTIHGGTATNVVPDRCTISIDRRYVPGEDPSDDEQKLRMLALTIDKQAQFESSVVGWPYYLPEGEQNPIIQNLSPLLDSAPIGHLPAYTEADLFYRKYNIPTIILGPGNIEQAHKTPEFVSIDQLELAVDYYSRILCHFFKL